MDVRANDDVILEILQSLPVKSLCIFKVVSKSWNNLISDPNFRAKDSSSILLFHYRWKRISSPGENAGGRDMGTVQLSWTNLQGTLLNSVTKEIPMMYWVSTLCGNFVCFHCSDDIIYVYNPFSQELAALPPVSRPRDIWSTGFGYIPETGEYKVVAIGRSDDSICEILTFNNNSGVDFSSCSWKPLKKTIPYKMLFFWGVYLENSIYWIIDDLYVIALDIINEKFKTINFPSEITSRYATTTHFLNFGGALSLVHLGKNFWTGKRTINIWRIKDEEGSEWIKVYGSSNYVTVKTEFDPRFLYNGKTLFKFDNGLLSFYNSEMGDFSGAIKTPNDGYFTNKILGIEESHCMLTRKSHLAGKILCLDHDFHV